MAGRFEASKDLIQMQFPVIQLNDVHFSWSSQLEEILHINQLSITQGEHLFIPGSSGSGKTTL